MRMSSSAPGSLVVVSGHTWPLALQGALLIAFHGYPGRWTSKSALVGRRF